ncbi:sensor histidine kinase [Candidatus Nitrosotenuis cloacae]|uniref:sensor histidine kinase n=1 Tax=Candidatus Nitrosotenuis cloacae TaxID=1603555 RepID=UPI002282C1DA|nr:sensor histidine kinase [Candidatus Nitrosotenuis cloacae]
MNREITVTLMVLVTTTASIVGILCFYTNNEIQRLNNDTVETKIHEVTAMSSRFALRLQYVTGMMEVISHNTTMADPPTYSNLISDQLKGIPEDADSEKRNIAKILLYKKFDLDYVFYVVPNGDIYFVEPFSSQLNVLQLNLSFRDWYRGAVDTGTTYVSEVYTSSNKQHNVISVVVPIYDDEKSLNGIFGGTLNLGAVQRAFSMLDLRPNEYMLITDHNHNVVVDSRQPESGVEIRRFQLTVPDSSSKTDTNVMTTVIDGKEVLVISREMHVGTHTWSFLSIQPIADAYASSNALKNEAILLIVAMTIISSTSGFIVIRKMYANVVLTQMLKKINLELEKKTEEIEQADIKKEEFAAMITHELKTPLMPIMGYCKMLKTKMLGELTGEQLESVVTIENNAKRLVSLIDDILDARKLDLNKMRFKMEDVSIDELFEEIHSSYKVLKEKGKEFVIDMQVHGSTIRTDKMRLRQVFDNLISNAIKFTPDEDAKIEVGAKYADNKIRFYVKDNGFGIPPEKQVNLFKKFYQIDTSERRKAGGTGLGLAISKGIVENLNGKIWVKSDGKSGSTFYFELPQ